MIIGMKTVSSPYYSAARCRPMSEREVMYALKKGRLNEEKVRLAVKIVRPWWYVAGRWANNEEDERGIDLWIQHKVMGWVPFQVKSSLAGLYHHERQGYWFEKNGGSRVPCVISNHQKGLSDIISQLERGFRFERIRGSFSKKRKAFKKLKR